MRFSVRSWLRFRLGHLLLVVLVLAIPLGWIARELNQMRRWRAAADLLEAMGCRVHNWYFVPDLPKAPAKFACGSAHARHLAEVQDHNAHVAEIESEWIRLRGMGPKLFGPDTYFRATDIAIPHGQASNIGTQEFWSALGTLDSLQGVCVTRDPDPFIEFLTSRSPACRRTDDFDPLQSPAAFDALMRLKSLKRLAIEGETPDELLVRYRPPSSLTSFSVTRSRGGSVAAWSQFFATSRIETLELNCNANTTTILEAAKELRSLKLLKLFDCVLDEATADALNALRPSEGCGILARAEDVTSVAAERLVRWGAAERTTPPENWRVFLRIVPIDRPREESP